MAEEAQFEFFYSNSSPFSQHHPSMFVIDGISYNCAEQYMMYSKAGLMHEKEEEGEVIFHGYLKFAEYAIKHHNYQLEDYASASLFNDEEMKKHILAATNPVEQKKFGRNVHPFDEDIWKAECENIVRKASIAKFEQNEHLRKDLFKTFPKTLVEASPRDTIWGIGLGASNPKALDKKTWRGQNKLGYILTEVRDQLMKQQK